MDKKEHLSKEYYTIDLVHIIKSLWARAWMIALVGLLTAAIGFSIAAFTIAPTYSSSIMLYVNNSSISLGNTSFSISSSQITAAQSLVKTYSEILKNRTTLERVIDKSGIDRDWKYLAGRITAESLNETEIMKVTVVSEDPYEAAKIANCIAEVLPIRISEIIDGASMEVVDSAVPNLNKIAPSITNYTAVGLVLGVIAMTTILTIVALMDDTIHDEDYIIQAYEYPILAKIPDLLGNESKRYGYRRYGYSRYGYSQYGDNKNTQNNQTKKGGVK